MNNVFQEIQPKNGSVNTSQKDLEAEYIRRKSTVIDLFKTFVKAQRLYFVLRSIVMGVISALITFP